MNEYEIKMVADFEKKHNRKPDQTEMLYISNLAYKIQIAIDNAKFDFNWFLATGEMDYTN